MEKITNLPLILEAIIIPLGLLFIFFSAYLAQSGDLSHAIMFGFGFASGIFLVSCTSYMVEFYYRNIKRR